MSLKEWKQKYYPITANKFAREHKNDLVALVDHAIQKWQGLAPRVLEKFDVYKFYYGRELTDDYKGSEFSIDMQSCSLCQVFNKDAVQANCDGCPLYESRRQVRCDFKAKGETYDDGPYGIWVDTGDNLPMVRALKKARRWAEKNSQ